MKMAFPPRLAGKDAWHLQGPHRYPKSRFPSFGFLVAVQLVFIVFLFSEGVIAKTHLNIEQAWSAELQDQNMHSLKIVAMQKKHISDLNKALQAQFEELHPEAREAI